VCSSDLRIKRPKAAQYRTTLTESDNASTSFGVAASSNDDAKSGANVMPALIDAAKADATVGEMVECMKTVFGRYSGGPEW